MTDEFSSAPLDVATLRTMAQRAESHPLVDDWSFRPDAMTPRSLVISLATGQYPAHIEDVRLDARWFENDDYSVHYVEAGGGTIRQCRWDRHPKPDEPRAHFHPPPDAADVEPSKVSEAHYLDVLFDVLDWVADRLEQLHEQ